MIVLGGQILFILMPFIAAANGVMERRLVSRTCNERECNHFWLVLGAFLQGLIRDERSTKVFNTVMGLALAASVLTILW